ncbi:type I-E CRISPR-associated protein Cas5/CasD [Methylocaldum szegediense]|uniref:Type I-E CRISPR system Cascade subunit CasD n=1 Tax=Methylocaldum szegediense TaxID=73780 RepID=A0ABN8X512_9GAMM|nr:type I-E CRISPR-associated protein Cas5/CasD [Methylocaldum szegediense]CAI8836713.1 type I-E CRISPR system Cascade subunit CasD [Methylocaldum szegediense]
MPRYLILRLDGPMQAWGTHTFEDFRPCNAFPTRSGLLGLLGACLGLDRRDTEALEQLAVSVEFTVRSDRTVLRPGASSPKDKTALKLPDFHTVESARKVDGSANKNPVVSRREYLFDAAFTVAIGEKPDAPIPLDKIAEALRRPYFTPVLGRRSCPIARPLLDGDVEASNGKAALMTAEPSGGLIYAEGELTSEQPLRIRDVPISGRHRQFGTRQVYLHKEETCS